MKNNLRNVIAVFLAVAALAGCGGGGGGSSNQSLSASKEITRFTFTSIATNAAIDEPAKTIKLTVPFGTDVTALVASFDTSGAGVTVSDAPQTSGVTANDFTHPVVYTVKAADGTAAQYTVTITIALNPAKTITAFGFSNPAVTGSIDSASRTISVVVPFGTNVTALVATFTTTGADVTVNGTTQTSGTTANDFTNPVAYTVTAADTTKATYTVTVTISPNPAKAITAFSFASLSATGVIDEAAKSILVTVPVGTNVTALVATFTTTGTGVTVNGTTQISGTTANDFTNPVVYTVTAADTNTAQYTVTVMVCGANTLLGVNACVCTAGFGNCDSNAVNGCEAGLTTLANCGSCGTLCSRANATATCSTGTCQIASCNAGYVNADGIDANGCEVSLNSNPACSTAQYQGSVSGDTPSTALSITGNGEQWFSVRIREDNSSILTYPYLSALISLTSASGTDYDLFVYCNTCSGNLAGSSQLGNGAVDKVSVRKNDMLFIDDTYDILIEIRFISGTSAANWTLGVQGNVTVAAATCN